MNSKTYKDKEFKTNEIIVGDIPGINQVQYTPGLEVKGSAGGVKVLYFSFASGTPLGVYNFTGFGFKPSSYIVQAWYASTASAITMSYASYINGAVQGFLAYGGTYAQMTSRMLAIYNGTSNTRANHSDFLDDGIALDFIENSESVKFTITAYK